MLGSLQIEIPRVAYVLTKTIRFLIGIFLFPQGWLLKSQIDLYFPSANILNNAKLVLFTC